MPESLKTGFTRCMEVTVKQISNMEYEKYQQYQTDSVVGLGPCYIII